jgi:peroxiredoxin
MARQAHTGDTDAALMHLSGKETQAMRKAGDPVPQASFRLRRDGAWLEKTSEDLFKGRAVVVFAVPAAFSTACSARHLPGYVALAKNIKAMGIDEIFCVAVNDAFVMNAWARDQGIDGEVSLLPDGNGDFARAMGMLEDRSDLGFGQRSRRYAMIVRDGIIDALFAEDPRHGADAFEVSDAITLLDFLDRQALRAVAE